MANILALDTSTDACSVALKVGGQIYARFDVVPRQHTKLLLPMVDEVLKEAGITVKDLELIGFGHGPGSFAGIRIATGAAQGLAVAFDTPMIGISTLEVLAHKVALDNPSVKYILATLDARMDEVYWALYENTEEGLNPLTVEQVTAPGEVVVPADVSSCVAVGSGMNYFDSMSADLQSKIGTLNAVDVTTYPEAEVMLSLAEKALEKGNTVAPEEALPVYIREGSWKKRNEQ